MIKYKVEYTYGNDCNWYCVTMGENCSLNEAIEYADKLLNNNDIIKTCVVAIIETVVYENSGPERREGS